MSLLVSGIQSLRSALPGNGPPLPTLLRSGFGDAMRSMTMQTASQLFPGVNFAPRGAGPQGPATGTSPQPTGGLQLPMPGGQALNVPGPRGFAAGPPGPGGMVPPGLAGPAMATAMPAAGGLVGTTLGVARALLTPAGTNAAATPPTNGPLANGAALPAGLASAAAVPGRALAAAVAQAPATAQAPASLPASTSATPLTAQPATAPPPATQTAATSAAPPPAAPAATAAPAAPPPAGATQPAPATPPTGLPHPVAQAAPPMRTDAAPGMVPPGQDRAMAMPAAPVAPSLPQATPAPAAPQGASLLAVAAPLAAVMQAPAGQQVAGNPQIAGNPQASAPLAGAIGGPARAELTPTGVYTAEGPGLRRRERMRVGAREIGAWMLALRDGRLHLVRPQDDTPREVARAFQWLFWVLALVAYGCLALVLGSFLLSFGELPSAPVMRRWTGEFALAGLVAAGGAWWLARRLAPAARRADPPQD